MPTVQNVRAMSAGAPSASNASAPSRRPFLVKSTRGAAVAEQPRVRDAAADGVADGEPLAERPAGEAVPVEDHPVVAWVKEGMARRGGSGSVNGVEGAVTGGVARTHRASPWRSGPSRAASLPPLPGKCAVDTPIATHGPRPISSSSSGPPPPRRRRSDGRRSVVLSESSKLHLASPRRRCGRRRRPGAWRTAAARRARAPAAPALSPPSRPAYRKRRQRLVSARRAAGSEPRFRGRPSLSKLTPPKPLPNVAAAAPSPSCGGKRAAVAARPK